MRKLLAPPPERPVEPGPLPTFSVVIAAYNAADVIGEALDSALEQTVPPLEIIVCDDGSTDDLDGALEPYGDRIRLLTKERGGEGSAKNAAAAAACGDFVVILDADDVFFPARLEALGELAAARPDLDILTTDAYLTVDGRVVRRCYDGSWTFAVEDQRREILRRNFIFGLAAVRRECLVSDGGFDESILWTTDWDRWLRLILEGSPAGAVEEPLALYRLRQSSLSTRREDLVRGKIMTLEKARLNPTLRSDERPVLEDAIADYRRELALSKLREALVERAPGGRRRALRLATARGYPLRERAEAAAAAIAPGISGRVLRSRADRFWIGAGGIRVARSRASDAAARGSIGGAPPL
jgi:glycosyltransferase involved in cell wall biosynthesis